MPRFRHRRQIDLFVLEHGRKALEELVITNNLDESSLQVFQDWLSPHSRWLRIGTYAVSAGLCTALLGGAVWATAMTVPLPLSREAAKAPASAPCGRSAMPLTATGAAPCAPLRPARDFD